MTTTHGHTWRDKETGKVRKSLTYQSWSSMNDRCYMDSHKWYHLYGGRGIQVCERWRRGMEGSFANFLADVGERPGKLMTLDRFPDLDGHYQKDNVRWATKEQQRANQRREQVPCNVPTISSEVSADPNDCISM